MSGYPERLSDESDKAYDHFCAWIDFEDRGARGATAAFATRRGIKPEQVRRLRSKYRWNDRAAAIPTLDTEIQQRASQIVIEQSAQTLAEKITAAKERNAATHAGLVGKLGQKVNDALERIDLANLDDFQLSQFIIRGMREMAPRESGPAVAVTQTTMNVEIDEVQALPPAQQAQRVRAIVAEADRRAALLNDYYNGQAAAA